MMDNNKIIANGGDDDDDDDDDDSEFSESEDFNMENDHDGTNLGDNMDEASSTIADDGAITEDDDSENESSEDDGDDTDDDDDEEDDDEEDEARTVAEINKLQDELRHNPYDYDKHVLLISKIKMIGELECLRSAREKMNTIYPLSPKHWTEWIEDEKSISTTVDQKTEVLALYERAVSEYLDIKLWQDYCQYAIEMKDSLGVDGVRKILDQSLLLAGVHVTQGSSMWKLYRDFEESIHENSPPMDAECPNQNPIPFERRILNLYNGQLSLPLSGMEQTFEEFQKWLKAIPINSGASTKAIIGEEEQKKIKIKYEKALKKYEILKVFEEKLSTSTPPSFEHYKEYLNFEKKNDDLPRTQCLFERAITDNCLQSDLWIDYLKYCDCKLVLKDILLPIYERAVRNCYWDANIWIRYMQASERVNIEDSDPDEIRKQVAKILERALKNCQFDQHKNLWLTYLHCCRRQTNKIGWDNVEEVSKLRESFRTAIDQLEPYQDVDYCYDIFKFYANVEADYCRNPENSRTIWEEFLEKSITLKYQANTWIEYGNFVLIHRGTKDDYRKIMLKGLHVCTDYPESIGQLLLRFEQENCDSIQQYFETNNSYEKVMKKINDRRVRQRQQQQQALAEAEAIEQSSKSQSSKRKLDDETKVNANKKKKKDIPPATTTDNHGRTVKTDEAKRDETIFVSNLDFSVDEDELKKVFAQFGNVQDVRLAKNFKGLSKGFAFVEFDGIAAVRKALANDRMLIRARPAYISEMDKRKGFQYEKNKEENKLFIKNIPLEITKDMLLEQVFPEYRDSIVDARLVTMRNGYSKGIAYVEMKDAKTAAKAVAEKDGFQIGDRKLLVAISDPSKSSSSSENERRTQPPSFGSRGSKITSGGEKPSSMVPYSVLRVRSQPSKVKIQVKGNQDERKSSSSQISSASNSTVSSPSEQKKSNEQFRSMFFKT